MKGAPLGRVFAPVRETHVPGDPDPAERVGRDRRVGFALGRGGHRPRPADRLQRPIGPGAKLAKVDVVAAVAVRVPGDDHAAVGRRHNRRLPVVVGVLAHVDGVGKPLRTKPPQHHFVVQVVGHRLPGQPKPSLRVRREPRPEVVQGIGCELLRAAVAIGPKVPLAAVVGRPNDPNPALGVHCAPRVDVLAPLGKRAGRVARAEDEPIGLAVPGHVGHGHPAVGQHRRRRVLLLGLVAGEGRYVGNPFEPDLAVEHGHRPIGAELFERDLEVAQLGRASEDRLVVGFHFHQQALGERRAIGPPQLGRGGRFGRVLGSEREAPPVHGVAQIVHPRPERNLAAARGQLAVAGNGRPDLLRIEGQQNREPIGPNRRTGKSQENRQHPNRELSERHDSPPW